METKRLASQLRRSYEGQAWHGPSLRELLEGVTSEQAAAKPISGAHSIWELVLHVTAWEQAALGFLEGKKYETLAGEKDWPPVQETWQAALDAFGSASHALVAAIRAMPEEKLKRIRRRRRIQFLLPAARRGPAQPVSCRDKSRC